MHRFFLRNHLFIALFAICAFVPHSSLAQKTVAGTVIDDQGEGLPGVTIQIKGTSSGTISNIDGAYSLQISGELDTLIFSYIGYESQMISVGGRTQIDITLVTDVESLEEVVVVGYGSQRKTDLTGSVASIDLNRIDAKPNSNFTQALQGSLPGVNITTNASGAEQDNVDILVRGRNSISANNTPLIVLDGIPYEGSISDINPSDIKSINLLKDASATAIYGSRGSNGVILIESLKGRAGKPTITYSGYYGISQIANLPKVYDGPGFATFKEEREPGELTDSELDILRNGTATDWVDLATQDGYRQEHTLSVRGGTDNMNYFVSAAVHDAEGVAVNDRFRRYSLRLNLSFDINENLEFGTNTLLTRLDRSGDSPDFDSDQGAFFMNPLSTAYDPDGNLTIFPWPEDDFFGNPLAPTVYTHNDFNSKIFTANYLNYEVPFVEGLSLRLNTGIEYDQRQEETYQGRGTKNGFLNQGRATVWNRVRTNFLVENILKYNKSFGKHSFDVTGLYSSQARERTNHSTTGEGFPNDVLTFYQLELAAQLTPNNVTNARTFERRTIVSQMGRVNYNYDNRFYGTYTIRRDGFSGFGPSNKYAAFSSAAFSWNLTNESFFPESRILNFAKLRLSYGENGNNAVGPYDALAALNDRSYVEGSQIAPGYIPDQLANESLQWETTASMNIGMDFLLFDEKIELTIDAYQSNTSDLLLDREIPSVHGISEIIQNVGETRNRGIEVAISSDLIEKAVSWNSSFNASFNKNEIVSLVGGEDQVADELFIGQPIEVNYGLKFDGIWQEGDDIANSAQPDAAPGHVRISDIDNALDDDSNAVLAITDDLDRVIQGQLDPKFIWGWQNTVSYKNFSLYVFMHGVVGVTKQNTTKNINVFGGVRRNAFVQEFWTPENRSNSYFANDIDANVRSVRFFENADFVRLKDVTLSYNFNNKIFGRTGIQNMRVYFTGRNLATITDWEGTDPELSDQEDIPLQREYVFGLNFSF